MYDHGKTGRKWDTFSQVTCKLDLKFFFKEASIEQALPEGNIYTDSQESSLQESNAPGDARGLL